MGSNKYLVVDPATFAALNDAANLEFGYPNVNTETYAAPIEHNDGAQVVLVVEPRLVSLLSVEQQAALLDAMPTGWVQKIPESQIESLLDNLSPAENVVADLNDSYVGEIQVEVTSAFDAGVTLTVAGTEVTADVVDTTIIAVGTYTAGVQQVIAQFNEVARTQGALIVRVGGRLIPNS